MALFLLVFLPLFSSIIVGFFGKRVNISLVHIFSCSLIVIPFFIASYFLNRSLGGDFNIFLPLATWLSSGDLLVQWSLKLDMLSSVMLVVVTLVSSLVHIYSIGYMSHDPHQNRFFAYLSFFTFAMLILVTSNNFLQLFLDGKVLALHRTY